MSVTFRNANTALRSVSEDEGYFATLSQTRRAKAASAREERRSLLAYEIETRVKERLGPMRRVKDAA
jgi:hypothetical protein